MLKEDSHIKNKAYSLTEVILAIGLFSFIVLVLAQSLAFTLDQSRTSTVISRANYLSDEGLEIVRNIRDNNFANLSNGTFALSQSGGSWNLVAGQETIDNIFTRTIQISTIDTNTKRVIVNINWPGNLSSGINSISTDTYLTNWKRIVSVIGFNNPSLTSNINLTNANTAIDVEVRNDLAFVIREGTALNFSIISYSIPNSPTVLSTLDLPANLTDICVNGSYVYITSTNNSSEIIVYNVSVPILPLLTSTVNIPGAADATGCFVKNNRLYVTREATAQPELYSYNITNGINTTPLAASDFATDSEKIYVSDSNYVFITSSDDNEEIKIFNGTNQNSFTQISGINLSGNNDALAVTGFGNNVIVSRTGGEIVIINIANINNPVVLSAVTPGGTISDLALDPTNTYLLAASNSATREYQVLNISNLAAPSLEASLNLTTATYGIAYDSTKHLVFIVGEHNEEFRIIKPN